MSRAIGLFSGGLDSILAVKVLLEQDVEVLAVTFVTPFFGSGRAEVWARQLEVPLRIVDICEEHLRMVKNPAHGYGRTMNPCIDCHALMLNHAGRIMEAEGYDFLFTGEVLGERPMSQNRQALGMVAVESGYGDVVVRPLSAQLLSETEVESKGLVDRTRLLAIRGRSRKPQMTLAREYGIADYPTPAGGCLLTEQQFSLRLRDLLDHNAEATVRDVRFLKEGRHFRLDDRTRFVCGRNHAENERLAKLAGPEDVVLRSFEVPGPTGVLIGSADEGTLKLAAALLVRYSDVPDDAIGSVRIDAGESGQVIKIRGCTQETIDRIQIK